MNISQKCICCVHDPVCMYKNIYRHAVISILDTIISDCGRKGGFWKLKDCPHVEVSIKCPHMVTHSSCKGA